MPHSQCQCIPPQTHASASAQCQQSADPQGSRRPRTHPHTPRDNREIPNTRTILVTRKKVCDSSDHTLKSEALKLRGSRGAAGAGTAARAAPP
eukprot:2474622-Prymnesium_polylepis.2